MKNCLDDLCCTAYRIVKALLLSLNLLPSSVVIACSVKYKILCYLLQVTSEDYCISIDYLFRSNEEVVSRSVNIILNN